MISETSKEREARHFQRFKDVYTNIPEGKIIHKDNPDFIIETGANIIGIEHTQLYRKKEKGKQLLQERWTLRNKAIKEAEIKYNNTGLPNIYVSVHFNELHEFPKTKVSDVAEKIFNTVLTNLPNVNGEKILRHFGPDVHLLPKEIASMSLYRWASFKNTMFHTSDAAVIPDNSIEFLQEILETKNKNFTRYSKVCDEVWLLIVEDGMELASSFNLKDSVKEHVYNSYFDRIFYFIYSRNYVYELNLRRE